MGPEVIAAGVFGIAGAVVGSAVGLIGQRWIRTLGEVRCETRWYPEQTAASESEASGVEVQQRHLEVTFRNGKDVPVTVWDMEVVFYKGEKHIDEDKRPVVDFADPASVPHGGRPLEPVNLPPHVPVTCTLRVVPVLPAIVIAYDPVKVQALKEADRVEFVAHMVGARDIVKRLAPWQDLTR
jgi:hypothetical protein